MSLFTHDLSFVTEAENNGNRMLDLFATICNCSLIEDINGVPGPDVTKRFKRHFAPCSVWKTKM